VQQDLDSLAVRLLAALLHWFTCCPPRVARIYVHTLGLILTSWLRTYVQPPFSAHPAKEDPPLVRDEASSSGLLSRSHQTTPSTRGDCQVSVEIPGVDSNCPGQRPMVAEGARLSFLATFPRYASLFSGVSRSSSAGCACQTPLCERLTRGRIMPLCSWSASRDDRGGSRHGLHAPCFAAMGPSSLANDMTRSRTGHSSKWSGKCSFAESKSTSSLRVHHLMRLEWSTVAQNSSRVFCCHPVDFGRSLLILAH
jgi:hypothetical protein